MNVPVAGGDMLVMPTHATGFPAVKIVTVAHQVTDSGSRIQGVHVAFDKTTLAPLAILDAPQLTLLRTTAVSLVALRRLVSPSARKLAVIGTGPQAATHALAIASEVPLEQIAFVGRRRDRADQLAREVSETTGVVAAGLSDPDDAVARADIVLCATSASTPVFHRSLTDGSCVIAIGTHTATTRELPTSAVSGAFVVVEDRETARRECGNVVIPQVTQEVRTSPVTCDLRELVQGRAPEPSDRRVFTSVGMAWEDAVVGQHILTALALDESHD